MENLEGLIQELATRHAISEAATRQLVNKLLTRGGIRVQLGVPEFGEMGQWMPGMVMAGDMFNHVQKARVDRICKDIAEKVRSGTLPATTLAFTRQNGFFDVALQPVLSRS